MEMDNEKRTPPESSAEEPYTPRPWWQVWGARLVLGVFILILILYYVTLFLGGV